MSRYIPWAVLTPGEPAWLERRARAIVMTEVDEEDGKAPPFEVRPGSGRYHAILGLDDMDVGAELQIAEELSLECDEPVYAIERANDPWLVMSFRHGVGEVEEVGPEALARSLGCPLPSKQRPSGSTERRPLRTVALVEGVRAQEAHRVLEEEAGHPLEPGRYRMEETPRGLLLAGGTGGMSSAYVTLSERIPHVTVYGVTASPDLDTFIVKVLRGTVGIGQFSKPSREDAFLPAVSEIKGEHSPDRILAVLGIPADWFSNE